MEGRVAGKGTYDDDKPLTRLKPINPRHRQGFNDTVRAQGVDEERWGFADRRPTIIEFN
jgi:hypothetical protein